MSPLNKKFLALDLELNQPSNKIIQVGIALGSPAQSEDDLLIRRWYLDPGEPIAAEIVTLTGITDEDIQAKAVSPAQCAAELSALIETQHPFVNPVTWGGADAHELRQFLREAGVEFKHFGRRWIDVKTWHVCQQMARGKATTGGLASVMGAHRLQFIGQAHRADVDAYNTLRLFFRMLARQQAVDQMLRLAESAH